MDGELTVEVGSECIDVWRKPWAKRAARVTLLVGLDDQFVVVKDISKGLWFLPGGGMERNESIEETAKREAVEELGLEIRVEKVIQTFHVTLISRETGGKCRIHPFISVYATATGGTLKEGYSPSKRLFLIGKDEILTLLQHGDRSREEDYLKPHRLVSIETVRQFLIE